MKRRQLDPRNERGVAMVLFAVILPLTFIFAAVVWDAGNWWVHRKHLQTKVDAAAFAGGGVWSIPCASDSDTSPTGTGIVDQARKYVGEHVQADGTPFTATTFNPQVGGTPGSNIHVVLNGTDWWDDDASLNPPDRTSPNNPSICASYTLDVKATEANNTPLFGWLPFFPDIKRKARVEIQEVEGLRGLLPIAVRVPKPLSAAAVFYRESDGHVLDIRYFREVCTPSVPACLAGVPAYATGLGQWTTVGALGGNMAQFPVAEETGVVIATSFRPECDPATPGQPAPCMEDTGFTSGPVDNFCRQVGNGVAPVKCEWATGSGASQTAQSGLQFINGYTSAAVTPDNGPPELREAYFDFPSANCGAYFSAPTGQCTALLNLTLDIGSYDPGAPGPPGGPETRTAGNTEVRYRIVSDTGTYCAFNLPACDLNGSGGPWNTNWTTTLNIPQFDPSSARNSIAIRVRLKEPTVLSNGGPPIDCNSQGTNCEFWFTAQGRSQTPPTDAQVLANPIQRSFMGNLDLSGPVKWLRLTMDTAGCDGLLPGLVIDADAASQPSGQQRCYYMEMGLQGGLAKDQDEPPIQLNIGATSQSSVLDCDDDPTLNLKDEIQFGCQNPAYAANKFNTSPLCPGSSQFFTTPKAAPFDDWPPFDCVLTQTTGAPNQVLQGFNLRLFGVSNNPTCPTEDTSWPVTTPPSPAPFTPGRNYWHNANNVIDEYTFADDLNDANPLNNKKNRLRSDDPRLANLFFTPYDSFTGNGNETYAAVGFGSFYITGYGFIQGNGSLVVEDPCTDGNVGNPLDGLPYGVGNEPPPDLVTTSSGAVLWGHYVKSVVPNPFTTGGNGVLCKPAASFQPCVAVLVE